MIKLENEDNNYNENEYKSTGYNIIQGYYSSEGSDPAREQKLE